MATNRWLWSLGVPALAALGMLSAASCRAQEADSMRLAPRLETDTTHTEEAGPGDARFVALGAGIGTPAGFTFIGGIYFAPLAVRVSGASWGPRWNGFQADLSLVFNHTSNFAQGLSLVAGVFRTNPVLPDASGTLVEQSKSDHYVGGTFDMYLAGFFFQIGLAHGRGDYPNPQLLVQCGYLFAL